MKMIPAFAIGLCACSFSLLPLNAVDIAPVPALTPEQRTAMDQITSGGVLSTVSFLSSDELAGRDTPSRELTIASAYVASRFRGAGLEPLGDDSTFYQTHNYQTFAAPSEPAVLSWQDDRVLRCQILIGGPKTVDLTAMVLSEQQALQNDAAPVVLIDEFVIPPRAVASPAMAMVACARRVRQLAKKGAEVVLMKCAALSPVRELAEMLRETPVAFRKTQQPANCCVVLIDDDADLLGQMVKVEADARRVIDNPVRNVVGLVPGADETLKDEAVLVTAHLDHIGRLSRGTDMINNGADDNATGVTAVLALADAFGQLRKSRPRRSVVFATFWGEEKGLLGSRAFVKDSPWPLISIRANVNIEMVGRPEPDAHRKLWMTGWKHSRLGSIMNTGASRAEVEVFHRSDVSEMLYTRSDNYAFVEHGVVAHSFSGGSLHHDYHQPTDEWTRLDISHMTSVIQGLFAGVLHVADGDDEIRLP